MGLKNEEMTGIHHPEVGNLFMIIQISFDTLENKLSDAISKYEVGVISGERDAQEWVGRLNEMYGHKFDGWDGKQYPYYEARKLEKFTPSLLNEFGHIGKML